MVGMTTVPLPSLPSRPPKSDADQTSTDTELQGLVFVSLSSDTSAETNEGEGEIQEVKPTHSYSDERVGAIQIFRDTCKCHVFVVFLS